LEQLDQRLKVLVVKTRFAIQDIGNMPVQLNLGHLVAHVPSPPNVIAY
jgi:hypothetical protein